jgi:hypothetical protein
MANTYQLIASTALTSGSASSISFNSISNAYTDLIVKCSFKSTTSGSAWDNLQISFNGSTSNYNWKGAYGYSGTNVGSNANTGALARFVGVLPQANNNTFSNGEIYIPNYLVNAYKSLSSDSVDEINSSSGNILSWDTNLWADTTAISSISFSIYGGASFSQYSTAYLYGVSNA